MTLGMDLGSDISEGTCTMKYSPKMHEELVRHHKAADLHPLQDESTLQGLLEIVYECGEYMKSISGMDAISLQPGGGSHAVFTNACVMRAYFAERGELPHRNEIITTIFSHPCDAATPSAPTLSSPPLVSVAIISGHGFATNASINCPHQPIPAFIVMKKHCVA